MKTEIKALKKLKMYEGTDISYEEAKVLLRNTIWEREFDFFNESTISKTIEFEQVQNRRYYLTKTGKKGSKLCKGSPCEETAKIGIFLIEMIWDFKHPFNFALNQNNVSRQFTILI